MRLVKSISRIFFLAAILFLVSTCGAVAENYDKTVTTEIVIDGENYTNTTHISWATTVYGELRELTLSSTEFLSFVEEQMVFSVRCDRAHAIVELYDESNNFIAFMYDDGTHGDSTINDGIYTYTHKHQSNAATRISYYAISGTSRSNDVVAYFYSAPTSEHFDQYANIVNEIARIEKPYTDESGYIRDLESAQHAFDAVLEYLLTEYENRSVIRLDVSGKTIEFTLPYGLLVIYEPSLGDCLSQGKQNSIITCLTTDEFSLGYFVRNKVHDAATYLQDGLVMYAFDQQNDSYDDKDGDIITLFKVPLILRPNSVILWVGHGAYGGSNGCYIGTNEEFTNETLERYSKFSYVKNREYAVSTSGMVYFSPMFVRNHCALSNSFVYFMCCYSAEIGPNDSMVQACIDAGADAYAGNLGSSEQSYAFNFLYDVITKMTHTNPDTDKLYTLREAQDYAYDQPYFDLYGSRFYASDGNYRFQDNPIDFPVTTVSPTPIPTVTPSSIPAVTATPTSIPVVTATPTATTTATPTPTPDYNIGHIRFVAEYEGRTDLNSVQYKLYHVENDYYPHRGASTSLEVNIPTSLLPAGNYILTLFKNGYGYETTVVEFELPESNASVDLGTIILKKTSSTPTTAPSDALSCTLSVSVVDYMTTFTLQCNNVQGEIVNFDVSVSNKNILLLDTAQGLVYDSTIITADQIIFQLDDELINGAIMTVSATDSSGQTFNGAMYLTIAMDGSYQVPSED